MCIFDEVGILLCTRTAEDSVFANRLSERVTLISFYSISLFFSFLQSTALWDLKGFNKPHLASAGGIPLFVFLLLIQNHSVIFIINIITTGGCVLCVCVGLSAGLRVKVLNQFTPNKVEGWSMGQGETQCVLLPIRLKTQIEEITFESGWKISDTCIGLCTVWCRSRCICGSLGSGMCSTDHFTWSSIDRRQRTCRTCVALFKWRIYSGSGILEASSSLIVSGFRARLVSGCEPRSHSGAHKGWRLS